MTKIQQPWTANRACDIIEHICRQAVNIQWKGNKLTDNDLKIALASASLEARDPNSQGIQFAPHFMLHGSAGKGKTLLGKFLFPPDVASMPPNNAGGIGQMDLRFGHKVLKIYDTGSAFFDNPALTAAIKFMYHNTWSAKTHGDRQDNDAAMAFITTNMSDPVQRLAGVESDKAFKRQFLEALNRLHSQCHPIPDELRLCHGLGYNE